MTRGAGPTTVRSSGRLRIFRRASDPWDADEVATHLMACRTQMLRGLGRRSPWVGIDEDTLDSCFTHAAAVIVKVAVSGQRPEWRTPADLEKAQVAAFRHQAQDHWKRVNAQSRRGDRLTVRFNADIHGTDHAPLERLFEQPDLHVIERDLLAELVDEHLRRFWEPVLRERLTFKESGDRLGLGRPEIIARTRTGRSAFSKYLDARVSGDLCLSRSADIVATRLGTADPIRVERAEAHLEACYACALVHEPSTSAFERGILGIGPTGLILRMVTRATDAASTPVMRVVDSGSGSRAVAAGVAALTIGAGIGSGLSRVAPAEKPHAKSSTVMNRHEVQSSAVSRARVREPVARTIAPVDRRPTAVRPKHKTYVRRSQVAVSRSPKTAPRAARAVAEQEFSPEVGSSVRSPSPRPTARRSPAVAEFSNP